jgi:hypothetical protein
MKLVFFLADQVLFPKQNLRTPASRSLKGNSAQSNSDVTAFTQSIDKPVPEAHKLIHSFDARDSPEFLRLNRPVLLFYSARESNKEFRSMDPQSPAPKSIFKNPYLYSAFVFAGVLIYIGILLVSRYESNREFERRNAEKAEEKRRADDLAAVEQLGGSELAIRSLYVSPAVIRHGETAQLCYDVANAKSVTLDPPAGEVWPSHNRCLALSAKKTTTYTLTITDPSGKSISETVDLQVH